MNAGAKGAARGRSRPATGARMFFAVWPDGAARRALAALAARVARESGGRAPAAANLHLTLAFVGAVAADRRDVLLAAGRDAAAAVAPFGIALDRLGAFRDAGIAWIGAAQTPTALAALVARLARNLEGAGFPVDRRPYAMHLTLARRCATPPSAIPRDRIDWDVRELTLVESVLRPGGPDYRIAARWILSGPSETSD